MRVSFMVEAPGGAALHHAGRAAVIGIRWPVLAALLGLLVVCACDSASPAPRASSTPSASASATAAGPASTPRTASGSVSLRAQAQAPSGDRLALIRSDDLI